MAKEKNHDGNCHNHIKLYILQNHIYSVTHGNKKFIKTCSCYGQQNLKMYDLKRDIKNDSTLNTVRIMGKLK